MIVRMVVNNVEADRDVRGNLTIRINCDYGEMVIERPRYGGETSVTYQPGLTAVYDANGDLSRMALRLREYMGNFGQETVRRMPADFLATLSQLKKQRVDLLLAVNFKGEWFSIIQEAHGGSRALFKGNIGEVLGKSKGIAMRVGLLRRRRVIYFQTQPEPSSFLVHVGVGDNYVESALVFTYMNVACLQGQIDEERVRAMLDLI